MIPLHHVPLKNFLSQPALSTIKPPDSLSEIQQRNTREHNADHAMDDKRSRRLREALPVGVGVLIAKHAASVSGALATRRLKRRSGMNVGRRGSNPEGCPRRGLNFGARTARNSIESTENIRAETHETGRRKTRSAERRMVGGWTAGSEDRRVRGGRLELM